MTTPSNQVQLIDELESRQNDVLDRLAELNARVEGLLNDCLAARDARLNDGAPSNPIVATPKPSAYAVDPVAADPMITE